MNKHGPHGIGRLVIHVHTVGFEYPSQDLREQMQDDVLQHSYYCHNWTQ